MIDEYMMSTLYKELDTWREVEIPGFVHNETIDS